MTDYQNVHTIEIKANSVDIAPNIVHPENIVIRFRKNRFHIYRYCYLDRVSLNKSIRSLNEKKKVNLSTLCSDRADLVRNWISAIIEGRINETISRTIATILDQIDSKSDSTNLASLKAAKLFYQSFIIDLQQQISLPNIAGKRTISRATAATKVRALAHLINISTNASLIEINTWANPIRYKDRGTIPQSRLSEQDSKIAFALHSRLFWTYSIAVLQSSKTPIIVKLEDLGFKDFVCFSTRIHSWNDWGEDTSKSSEIWKRFAFSSKGFQSNWSEIENISLEHGIDIRPKFKRGYLPYDNHYAYKKRALNSEGRFPPGTYKIFSDRASVHFAFMIMFASGANITHLEYINFTNTRLEKTSGAERIIAVKGRSEYEAQNLYVDARFNKAWRQYQALRSWMQSKISSQLPKYGILKFSRSHTNYSVIDSSDLKQTLVWPKNAPSLVSRPAKKLKSQKLLEVSKGDIGMVAHVTSTSVKTICKHYAFKTAEDAARQLSKFFDAVQVSAKLRVSGEAVAPVVTGGKKIHSGRCTGSTETDIKLIDGYDERAPEPRCGAPTSCLFCTSYGIHASAEDITRLLSVKMWVSYQSRHKSNSLEEHSKKYLPIVSRIDEILEAFSDRDEPSRKIYEQSLSDVNAGKLDPFWQLQIDTLIDTIEGS